MWNDIPTKMFYSWKGTSKTKTYPNCWMEIHLSVALYILMKCQLELHGILESVVFETVEDIIDKNIVFSHAP